MCTDGEGRSRPHSFVNSLSPLDSVIWREGSQSMCHGAKLVAQSAVQIQITHWITRWLLIRSRRANILRLAVAVGVATVISIATARELSLLAMDSPERLVPQRGCCSCSEGGITLRLMVRLGSLAAPAFLTTCAKHPQLLSAQLDLEALVSTPRFASNAIEDLFGRSGAMNRRCQHTKFQQPGRILDCGVRFRHAACREGFKWKQLLRVRRC